MKKFFLLFSGLILVAIVWGMLASESIDDLEGGFEQVAFARNANNTGPVKRVYAVTVRDTLWEEMKTYGDYLPYTKYGNTSVYFFRDEGHTLQKIGLSDPAFDPKFQPQCIGKFEKDASGVPTFKKYPFR